MFRKFVAICSAGMICCTMAGTSWMVSAEESTLKTVTWPKSDALYYEVKDDSGNVSLKPLPDSQITEQITVTVHEHPVHLTISRYSTEAPVTYYDVDLAPQEGETVTEYVFLVDYSECPLDPSQFETTYTSPYLTGIYSAAYTVEISEPKTDGALYREEELIIADPHAEASITGATKYSYDVSFAEELEDPVFSSEASASPSENGDLTISRSIQLRWKPYTLGDVDDNGTIDTLDAYYILLYYACTAASLEPPENVLKEAADINEDGYVDTVDAYLALLYYAYISAGIETTMEELVAAL